MAQDAPKIARGTYKLKMGSDDVVVQPDPTTDHGAKFYVMSDEGSNVWNVAPVDGEEGVYQLACIGYGVGHANTQNGDGAEILGYPVTHQDRWAAWELAPVEGTPDTYRIVLDRVDEETAVMWAVLQDDQLSQVQLDVLPLETVDGVAFTFEKHS